jgi:hypothetical protein
MECHIVQRILKDDIYIGTLRLGKYYRKGIKGRTIKASEDKHYVFENNHAPIIDKNQFEFVQSIINKRKTINYRGNEKHDNLFSGFLICKHCGASLCALNSKKEKGTYVCSTYHRFGKSKCSRNSVKETELIALFKEALVFIKEEYLNEILAANIEVQKHFNNSLDQNDSIDKLKRKLQLKKDELRINIMQKNKDTAKENDDFTRILIEQTYDDIVCNITSQIYYLTQKISDVEELINESNKQKDQNLDALELFEKLINKKKPDRKDLELLLEKIIIYNNGNKILQLLI